MFGLWRRYWHRPTYDPDAFLTLKDLEYTPPTPPQSLPFVSQFKNSLLHASKTFSLDKINEWVMARPVTQKIDEEMRHLIHDVILDDRFLQTNPALKGYDPVKERERMDKELSSKDSPFTTGAFNTSSIDIEVPSGGSSVPPKTVSVPGLHYRKLTDVIKEAFSSPIALRYHYTPFELRVESTTDSDHNGEGTRVYSKVYHSDAFINEHDHLQRHGRTVPMYSREGFRCSHDLVRLYTSSTIWNC